MFDVENFLSHGDQVFRVWLHSILKGNQVSIKKFNIRSQKKKSEKQEEGKEEKADKKEAGAQNGVAAEKLVRPSSSGLLSVLGNWLFGSALYVLSN
jgi:hypothetical protein